MSTHGVLMLVQGLAGSGKSHLISLLKYDFLIEENFAAGDEEERNIAALVHELRAGRRCIVSERKYRSNEERTKFLSTVRGMVAPSPSPSVVIICFENDLDAANHNCRERLNKPGDINGQGHIAQNNEDSKNYEIPDDAMVVRIHRLSVKTQQA